MNRVRHKILLVLATEGPELSLDELHRRLDRAGCCPPSRHALTPVLANLEDDGLVTSRIDETKAYLVRVTEAGAKEVR